MPEFDWSRADFRPVDALESMADGFMALDRDWRITYVNAAAETTNGLTRELLLGKTHWEAFPSVLGTEFEDALRKAMAQRVPIRGESFYEPYGRWFEMDIHPLQNGGLAFYGRDITERKRLQRERDELLARLQLQFERMPIACAVFDRQSRVVEWNPAAEATFGYGRDEVMGRDGLLLLVPPALRPQRQALIDRLTLGDMSAHAVNENLTKDGRTIICEWHNTPLRNAAGEVTAVLSMVLDITKRAQAEEARRATEERFRRLFELGTLGRAIISPAKVLLEVSDAFCSILGYQRGELLQKSWLELTHPDDLPADVKQFNRVLAGEIDVYSMEKRWIRKDGTIVDTILWVNCVRHEDGAVDYFVAQVQDITERKRANEALRRSEERYRSLISQVRDFAIFSTDDCGVVTTWNEGCQYVLGYTEQEFVGLDSAELFTLEDRSGGVPMAERREAVEAGTARIDRWMTAKDGRQFFGMGATAALKDPAGRLTGFSTVLRDLTQMKVTQDDLAHHGEVLEKLVTERTDELEKTTERLRLSERMASLGTLAAGLGHDMGNLLLPLDIRLDLLLQADLPRDLHEHVLGIQKCARYLQRLSSGLRLLAIDPLTSSTRETTELGAWWNDVGMILKDVLPGAVRLDHSLPPRECWVAIGRTGLTQAVFNVVQNSADALKERGYGLVMISVDDDPNASEVTVRVTDDGPGMTEEVARHCREPYFSTKARGESTGMGLAFVHGLVTGIGGRVEIDGGLGRGTSLSLILPRAPLERRAEATAAGAPRKRSRVPRALIPRTGR